MRPKARAGPVDNVHNPAAWKRFEGVAHYPGHVRGVFHGKNIQ
jgi:hypothetical protein